MMDSVRGVSNWRGQSLDNIQFALGTYTTQQQQLASRTLQLNAALAQIQACTPFDWLIGSLGLIQILTGVNNIEDLTNDNAEKSVK